MSLGRNILWNLASFVWLSALLIAVIPFMVSHLGLEAFGIWSVLMAFVGYLVQVDLGLGNALIRFLAVEHEREDHDAFERTLRAGLAIQLLLGAAAAGLFFFLGPFLIERWAHVPAPLMKETVAAFRIASVAVFLAFPMAVFGAVPAALRRFDLVAARWLIFSTVQYGLFVLLLATGRGLFAVASASAVSLALALVFLMLVAARLRPGIRLTPAWSSESIRTLLRFGRFKFTAQVAVSFLQQFDRVALAALLPVQQVSFYAVPLRVSQRISGMVEHIAAPFYPAISSHLAGGRTDLLRAEYRDGVRAIAVVAAGAVAVVGGLAYPLLAVWIDPVFAGHGAWPLRVLLITYSASALAILPSVAADAAGRPGIPAATLSAGAVLHAGLLFVLIPRFGLNGAATAVLAGFLFPLLVGAPLIHRRVPELPGLWSLVGAVRGAILAAAGTGVLTVFLARSPYPASGVGPLLVTLAGAGAAYLVLLILFGGLRRDDLRRFRRLLGSALDAANRD